MVNRETLDQLNRTLAERKLYEFVKQSWAQVDPDPFVPGWHLQAVCEHLQAVTAGQIKNLVVNIPPRSAKSTITSVMWPAWVWIHRPETRWLCSSYAQNLALRDSVKCRRLILSAWYQDRWGDRFTLMGDQNAKVRFDNSAGGYRISTSVGGQVTGEGGDILLCLCYNTVVRTDAGLLPIGRIVEERLPVRVLAFNHAEGRPEWREIEAYEANPGREAVRVTLSNQTQIDATAEHPFFVIGRGYVAASELAEGDEVLTDESAMLGLWEGVRSAPGPSGASGEAPVLQPHMSRGMAARGEQSRLSRREDRLPLYSMRHDVPCQALSPSAWKREVLLGSVPKSGLSRSTAFKEAGCVHSVRLLRDLFSDHSGSGGEEEVLLPTMRQSGASGTNEGRGEWSLCTRTFGRALLRRLPRPRADDPGAGWASMLSVPHDAGSQRQGTGRSPHRLRQGQQRAAESGGAVPDMPRGDARLAAQSEAVARTVVLRVESIPRPERVYNLRVAVDHNFFAGGILVHNCDDPHNVMAAESDVQRGEVLAWWDAAMSTRGNNPKTVARVIIAQRVHEGDLCGHVIAKGTYDHLCLPAQYEPDHPTPSRTALGFVDPRTAEGELLDPGRFGSAEIARLTADLTPLRAAGQLQQRPAPREGSIFKLAWMTSIPALPAQATRVRAWDLAATDGSDSAFTAGVRMAKTPKGLFVIEDLVMGRWTPAERDRVIKNTAEKDGRECQVWIEQEPGSGGIAQVDALIRQLAGYAVRGERSTGDKVTRADPLASQFEAGNVRIYEHLPYRADYESHLVLFPNGRVKDDVDASSLAFTKLAGKREIGFY